ncbi:MAG: hypothetical protein HY927_06765 [Elusimicrobia bacterium]|nr:hypothetical protein [Elusimicrobiota bacterium]
MKEVLLGGRRIKLDPSRLIGTGGEADVYDIGSGLALKLYKAPDHPDYRGLPDEQRGAKERLAACADKLREFPASLPPRVVAPMETAMDKAGRAAGYSMRLVPDAEPLHRWAEPGFRRAVPPAVVGPLFLDLHATVARLHEAGVVIGDFNDLNVLVAAGLAHLIDADSFQFGRHPCRTYTERFVDPLTCDCRDLRPVRPHDSASDWYAFETLLFQSLLLVHPYGGVLPGDQGRPSERALARITVLDPRVRYPRPAVPWRALPDELLHRFHATFVRDERSPFPHGLLESLRWTRCPSCGAFHARLSCPACAGLAPGGQVVAGAGRSPFAGDGLAAAVRQVVTVHGRVKAQRLLLTAGEVVAVGPEGWLVYEAGEFRREDGSVAFRGPMRPQTRYFLSGNRTVAAGRREAFAFADGRSWWERDGALWREGALGDERVGEVLAGQTSFWVGPQFGFGFYRAGGITVAFVFDGVRRGLADGVALPPLRGRVIDADCAFGDGRAWLILHLEAGGRFTRRCVVIRRDGSVAAAADSPPWLEAVQGACAAGPYLFVPTDRGIVRVEESLARWTEFPETEPFVDASSRLAAGPGGLIVANRREVVKLSLTQEVSP